MGGKFLFARKIGDKYGKKVIGTAIKTVKIVAIDAAKTAPKKVLQKIAGKKPLAVKYRKVKEANQ